ncbi:MAG TPA: ABC transporter permease, partial [Gammaproteobacteria bacterium]|nr:ABC transporter permease [Gammaproteobacteria bacterium]
MKLLPLVWAGLWRKRARTVLTLFSVAVAFVLFGSLHSVTGSLDNVIQSIDADRLRTVSRVNLLEPIPLAYLPQIESVKGVEKVAYYSIVFGYYQEPSNSIGVGAISAERFFDAFSKDLVLPEEQRAAMLHTRTGAVIGKDLAEKYGWKIGDRVPIRSARDVRKDGAAEWTFDVVGIYSIKGDAGDADEFWINYDYFDEERAAQNGTVNFYFERIADPSRAADVSASIDALFLNSTSPTQTQSDKEWVRAQINQIGDIKFFVNAIVGAVLFALLFLTGNTMMQSVRERIPELAVLKTYGYGDGLVISLVCAEALLLCVTA